MRRTTLVIATSAAAAVVGVIAATAGNGGTGGETMSQAPHRTHSTGAATATTLTASDLRNTLNRLLGEHAVLAMNATNLGVTGSKSFPAAAKALDRNSVALSQAIGSIYGAKAAKTFLDGPFQWRAHVKFFVDYTVALAKKDATGQNRAVANLKTYTVRHGDFLAGATGLPKLAVRNDLLGHVLELKNQLDAYASGNYAKAADTYRAAYAHMFMTGDLLSGAIAKQKSLR
ncbi:MAG TPA: hypothetical protein VFO26_11770 [Gaiella sp.]|uniref:hypothetical protein n=1 Tax=Gaiella sp. TaxID=2663207 RepID=UPI002D80DA0A|nr:hypothetical protein [Gaiella sp.]HET9288222.1 hypothetical protein [Gaiella sp.]